jgi:hypothetical protein
MTFICSGKPDLPEKSSSFNKGRDVLPDLECGGTFSSIYEIWNALQGFGCSQLRKRATVSKGKPKQ